MEVYRKSPWLVLLLGLLYLAATLYDVHGEAQPDGPSESECRPYIEKALKELETAEAADLNSDINVGRDESEEMLTVEITADYSDIEDDDVDSDQNDIEYLSGKDEAGDIIMSAESAESDRSDEETASNTSADDSTKLTKKKQQKVDDKSEGHDEKNTESSENLNTKDESSEDINIFDDDVRLSAEDDVLSDEKESAEAEMGAKDGDDKREEVVDESLENVNASEEDQPDESSTEDDAIASKEKENYSTHTSDDEGSQEYKIDSTYDVEIEENIAQEESEEEITLNIADIKDDVEKNEVNEIESAEDFIEVDKDYIHNLQFAQNDNDKDDSKDDEDAVDNKTLGEGFQEAKQTNDSKDGAEAIDDTSLEEAGAESEEAEGANEREDSKGDIVVEDEKHSEEDASVKESDENIGINNISEDFDVGSDDSNEVGTRSGESAPEEDLISDDEIPEDLRPRDHISQLLKLNDENEKTEKITNTVADITLRDLKKLYEHAIKPLEVLYKYRDLSNRHFGDSEIFSKPLVLFMGPWSGGKSSIINYLVDNEYKDTSLKTGAEPSPAYFNILMYGDEPEVLDGTQLAADYTFSGLQKFGQGLEERLRGLKLPKKLLEKINIVEIPGILEVRKQVSRVFPFNDACQWFIDRADIIFLVYDPSKLDVGPETEAILDQLKGREHQTRIILNKADQVKPEELMRVQGALIWNISPLMSSAQPPVMYTTSLWSIPYEHWAPVRLLQAQERAFLRDLRSAIDKRIDNKISSARRFAVRVRNHAKMVDCYLTTYYNHKSVFGNRKQVSDAIIERPQDYHIYEGLSTLTNISRYDLPDPDVYRDFFRLNPLYDFQQLSATCTYFRGCPINRLDVAIAYDLPELVGRHKRRLEAALFEADPAQTPVS